MLVAERKEDVLENRTDCMNRVHEFANEVVPKLIDCLNHGFRLTNGFQLFSKDKDRLQDVIRIAGEKGILSDGSNGARGSSAWLRSDEFNIYLEISDNYPVRYHNDGSGGYSCEYYKVTAYLWNVKDDKSSDFKPYEMVDYGLVKEAKVRLTEINNEISKLKSELYPLQRLTGSQR